MRKRHGAFFNYVKAGLPLLIEDDLYVKLDDKRKRLRFEFGDLHRELYFNGKRTWILVEVDDDTGLSLHNLAKFWYSFLYKSDDELLQEAKIVLLHIYQKGSQDHHGARVLTWNLLIQRIKEEIGDHFDAALFPIWFPSKEQDLNLQRVKATLEYVLQHGILPPIKSSDEVSSSTDLHSA